MRIGPTVATAERLTKLAYAERLTAALALLLLRQRDAVGLVRFDDHIRSSIAPRARNAARGEQQEPVAWEALADRLAQESAARTVG